jgi:uncharacterized protein YkwD
MEAAKAYFIPHHSNNHWPIALRHGPLAITSTLLIALKIAAFVLVAAIPQHAELSTITTSRIIQLTNAERQKVGLSALTVNSKLSQAAQQKGQDMLKNQYFAHISPSGVTPWFWMKKAGYSYSVAGENLAIDFIDAEEVVTAWLNSPSHKANMLGRDYTETGVAVVSGEFQGGTSIIVVHMFGVPLQSSTPTPAVQGQSTIPPAPAATASATPNPTKIPTPAITPVAATSTPEPTLQPTVEPTSGPTVEPTPSATPLPLTTLLPPPPQEPRNPRIAFLLSPSFDKSVVALIERGSDNPWQIFSARSPLSVDHEVFAAAPSFSLPSSELFSEGRTTFIQWSRGVTAGILIAVASLLCLAIVIRIKIQHPALITHASLVVMLAAILLVV